MDLELSNLVLKYAALRVLDPARVGRLVAALSREDQRSPVLVVGDGVLVDGYHRVEALRELGRDIVGAVRLEVPEAEALILAWRLETGRRKTALEEGWLLVELAETHGRTQTALAEELRRTRSWVSQRLGLVRALPEPVQEAVRSARIPAQAAMKSLLPLARLDREACERLATAPSEPLTVRQWEQICAGWRKADPEGRLRIEQNPVLLLKTEEAVSPVPIDAEEKLAQDLEGVAGLCRRARKQVRAGVFARANTGPCSAAWIQAREAFASLEQEVRRAELPHP
jgi:ParB family transcriptional regulator, chromosome partitioning protein